MDPILNFLFYSSGQLLSPAGGLGLLPHHPHDALRHQTPPSFTHPNQPDPWILVQCDQPAAYQCLVGGPGRRPFT